MTLGLPMPVLPVDEALTLLREGELELVGQALGIDQQRDAVPGRARGAASRPRASTSRSWANGRWATSRTTRWRGARWPPSWSPGRPAGRSCRPRSCATDRSARAWSSSGSRRTTRWTRWRWSSTRTRACGAWPPSTPRSTTPIARPGTWSRCRAGTCTAWTTASRSRPCPSCGPCSGPGAASRSPTRSWRCSRGLRLGLDGALGTELRELLDPIEVAATARRIDRLLEAGVFPQPDPRWPALPWPPV